VYIYISDSVPGVDRIWMMSFKQNNENGNIVEHSRFYVLQDDYNIYIYINDTVCIYICKYGCIHVPILHVYNMLRLASMLG
jgi:hypothetical protein